MGAINTTITLTNPANPSKTHTMEALVDTGAVVLALPRDVVDFLGLDIFDQAVATLATGETTSLDVAGAVEIEISGRRMRTDCFVLPAAREALIGQIVLERLDLIADCNQGTVYPRHGSSPYPVLNLKGCSTG